MNILEKITNPEYFCSYSQLSRFATSPAHFLAYHEDKSEPTRVMILGSAAHCLCLEPDKFDEKYYVLPDCDRRTKEGKSIYEQSIQWADGKELITTNEFIELEAKKNVFKTLLAEFDISIQESEKRVTGIINEVPFQGIIDGIGINYRIELKTTKDASPEKFRWEFRNRNYDLQDAIYSKLSGIEKSYIIAIDDTAGTVFEVSVETQIQAAAKMNTIIDNFRFWRSMGAKCEGYNFSAGNNIIEL